jgi:hypothetical protein
VLFPTADENVLFPRIPRFSFALADAKANRDLLVRVHSNKKSGMHLINVVAASQFTRSGECRGDLALFPLQTLRHPPRQSSSAVATTLRVHSVIPLSLAVMSGMPGAPQQSVGGR